MNRREFAASSVGVVLASNLALGRVGAVPSTPDRSHFREPETIAQGLTLIDQRLVLRSEGDSMFFGEILNELETIYDSPLFLQTFLDGEQNILGENFVYPVVGFMRAGETDYLVSPARGQFDPQVEDWDSYQLVPRHAWPSQVQIAGTYNPGLVIDSVISESLGHDGYKATLVAINTTDAPINGGTAKAAVRDANQRFTGYGQTQISSVIPPGKKARFRVSLRPHSGDLYNPFKYLETDAYSVELSVSGIAY